MDLVIIGAGYPEGIKLSYNFRDIIAVDSGYDTALSLGFESTIIVGDMDSVKKKGEAIERGAVVLKRDKDESDFEASLSYVKDDYILLGGGGGRIEHTLSILSVFRKVKSPVLWLTDFNSCYKIKKGARIILKEGTELSFFSLEKEARVESEGLKWELNDFPLSPSFISLSNRAMKSEVILKTDKEIFACFDISLFGKVKVVTDL